MDGERFDALAKRFVTKATRRGVLRGLAVGGAGLAAARIGTGGADAADPRFCGHSTGPNGGCKGACTAAGFTGNQCNPICGNGQFVGACPAGQGGGNPCCNPGYCNPNNFVRGANGNPVYVGPTSGCS
jgi:hypothetical protein